MPVQRDSILYVPLHGVSGNVSPKWGEVDHTVAGPAPLWLVNTAETSAERSGWPRCRSRLGSRPGYTCGSNYAEKLHGYPSYSCRNSTVRLVAPGVSPMLRKIVHFAHQAHHEAIQRIRKIPIVEVVGGPPESFGVTQGNQHLLPKLL
jgi:hypothetical protein